MITAITLKNFKCFKEETRIPTNQFNLLTGINGRGKSTALQPLLLFKQTIEINMLSTQLFLNGTEAELGAFDDVKNNQTSTNEWIDIGFDFSNKQRNIKFHFRQSPIDEMNLLLEHLNYFDTENNKDAILTIRGIEEVDDELSDFKYSTAVVWGLEEETDLIDMILFGFSFSDIILFKSIRYISADRLGPKEYHLKKSLAKFPTVGVKGENVVNILLKKGEELVNDILYIQERKLTNTKNISKDLLTQTGEWLNEFFDGGNIQLEDTQSKIANLLLNTTGKEQDKHNKPANIGFGFSYALPIIVSGLIAKEGEILIIENPEAYLHPRAQSRITKFLAKVSQCGVQVFIETHSDHVLNASRIAVLDDIITNEQLNILYFSDDEKNQVVTIPVKEDGSIEEWPDGFFDQTDKDYERLFGL